MSVLALQSLRLNLGRSLAVLLALAANLAIFCAAPWLITSDITTLGSQAPAYLSYIPLSQPPPLEEEPEPPPTEPEPPVFRMETSQPMPTPQAPRLEMELPNLDIEFNPSLSDGPRLPALPALPPAPPAAASTGLAAPNTGKFNSDRPPMVAARVPPMYPYFARRRGIEGKVWVRLLISADGQVRQSEVIRSKPPGVFEDSVMAAVKQWRFTPAVRGGKPIQAWVETSVSFELK